jgi:outer membrane receptor protein involved in Fe transport
MRKTLLLAGAAAFAMTAYAVPAVAQDAEEDAEARQDTIVITARKKDEGLLEAPIAVSAFDEKALEDLQLQTVDDIARFTPGLSFSKAFGRSTERPVIRGQSNVLAGVQFGVESGTAYFVDGVYYAGSIQNLDPNELARVEVIKGPQSALYGRNTYAGAINFITRGGSEEFEANGKLRFGNNGTKEASLSVAGPLPFIDGLSGRLNYRGYEYDGEFTNAVTDQLVGDESTISLSGVLDWQPTENFDARLRINYNEDKDGPLPLFLQDASHNNCEPGYRSLASHFFIPGFEGVPFPRPAYTNNNQYFCGVIEPGQVALNTDVDADGIPNVIPGALEGTNFIPFYSLADGTAFDGLDREQTIISLTSSYEFSNGYELRFLAGYRDETELTGFDSDHSPVNWFISGPTQEPFFANTGRDDVEDYSFEIKLSSPQDNRLRWLAGLYYYDQDVLDSDITFADPDGSDTPTGERGIENQAIFGLIEYDVTDRLSVTVEGRYAEETKTDSTSPLGSADFDAFTPRLTVDYALENGGTVYGIFSQGVKPGGLNGSTGAAIGLPTYEQEESDNFEVGLKTPVMNTGFNFTAAAFFTDATNVQLTTAVATPTGALNSVATNQGSGEILGLELDISGAFNDNWSGGATYAWTDTEFTEGCDPDEWIITSGGGLLTDPDTGTGTDFTALFPGSGPATCSIEGRQFPLTSEHQASAFLRYDLAAAGPYQSDFFASADLTYESSKFVQVHNRAETGDATILGARMGFEHEDWTFSVYGQNITDEDSIVMATRWLQTPYFFAGINTAPNTTPATASRSAPRAFFGSLRRGPQYGAELKLRF